jgi:hypothetical protein
MNATAPREAVGVGARRPRCHRRNIDNDTALDTVNTDQRRDDRFVARQLNRSASPPISPSCRSCCGAADAKGSNTPALAAEVVSSSNVQRHHATRVSGVVDISDAHQFDNSVTGADSHLVVVPET